MREDGGGLYNESNTVLLDTDTRSSSHPQNVLVVPKWFGCDDKAGMAMLKEYLLGAGADGGLVASSPCSVADYLEQNVCTAFGHEKDYW